MKVDQSNGGHGEKNAICRQWARMKTSSYLPERGDATLQELLHQDDYGDKGRFEGKTPAMEDRSDVLQ